MGVGGVSVDRERLGWWLAAAALGAAVAYVVAAFLGTFLLGVFVYYATRPIHRRLERRVRQPTLTTVVALFGLALPGLLLLGYTVLVSVRELSGLVGTSIDDLTGILDLNVDTSVLLDPQQLRDLVQGNPLDALPTGSADAFREVFESAVTILGVFASVALGIVITLVVAFYLLRDGDQLAAWFRTEVASPDTATYRFAAAVDHDLETVYFGNILTAFVIGIVAAVMYHLLDAVAPAALSVPSPTLLGLLTGLASLVPVVGMKLVYFPLGAVMAAIAARADPALLWFPAVFLLVSLVIVDTIPELLLRPYVSGRDLHTGLVMLAYVLGPVLFGWYGLFLGPLLLVLVVHFVRIVLPELVDPDDFTSVPDARDAGPPGASPDRRVAAARAPAAALVARERSPDGGSPPDGSSSSGAGSNSSDGESRSPGTSARDPDSTESGSRARRGSDGPDDEPRR